VPSKTINKLCTHAHHNDRSVAGPISANGTYFGGYASYIADTNEACLRTKHDLIENGRVPAGDDDDTTL
jgi:hypothetical protein